MLPLICFSQSHTVVLSRPGTRSLAVADASPAGLVEAEAPVTGVQVHQLATSAGKEATAPGTQAQESDTGDSTRHNRMLHANSGNALWHWFHGSSFSPGVPGKLLGQGQDDTCMEFQENV